MTPTTFRALVVDDEALPRSQALAAAAPDRGIDVLVAASKAEAMELIASNFLHVAIVDLELRRSQRELAEGRQVLQVLKAARPSCRRILLTQYATQLPDPIFALLDPRSPSIHGAIDKARLDDYFDRYLSAAAEEWHRGPVRIANLEEVHALVQDKPIRGPEVDTPDRRAAVTIDELQYVLASLFGQRARRDQPKQDDIASITLAPFLGGKSRSVVLHGRPCDRTGRPGLLSVVKIGPREEAAQELERYQRYVRFRMSMRRRVELLGYVIGDTLGAIAYTFAGEDPDHVNDLQTLLDEDNPAALDHLASLLRPDGSSTVSDDGNDLGQFFADAYDLRPRRVCQGVEQLVDDWAAEFGWQHRGAKLIINGGHLTLPDEVLGSGLLHAKYHSTIVHGDFNASNVIIANFGERILIDYRHTDRGPRALDYAAMHTSARISKPARERDPALALSDERAEYALWHHDWSMSDGWWPARANEPPPPWLVFAARLMELAHGNVSGLTRGEYAATCWLYALRVLRVNELERDAKLRLLIWISALSRVIADEDRAASEADAADRDAAHPGAE